MWYHSGKLSVWGHLGTVEAQVLVSDKMEQPAPKGEKRLPQHVAREWQGARKHRLRSFTHCFMYCPALGAAFGCSGPGTRKDITVLSSVHTQKEMCKTMS